MQSAEIIAIGTEILLGQITDTNSQFLSEELAKIGIDCFYHTTVGDNPDRIIQVLRSALSRSDLVVTTGGLGPTADDITMECIANAFGSQLIMDDQILSELEEFFKSRGYSMPESNKKQAMRPRGAETLPNNRGSAPGIVWEIERSELVKKGIISSDAICGSSKMSTIVTFPGVPHELKHMWKDSYYPLLVNKIAGSTIFSVDLKHIGIGESSLAEKYDDLLKGKNPTVAPYAGRGECRLRVTAKAKTKVEAQKLAEPVVTKIEKASGHLCYGRDRETLESVVGDLLVKQEQSLSLAESCTGGLVSKRLTDVSGSSRYIGLNFVTYSNEAKMNELNVSSALLESDGAVSAACAAAMAKGARARAKTDIGVGITGIAGPVGGTEEKPIGLVYLGLDSDKGTLTKELKLGNKSTRSEIRYRTSNESLNMIRLHLMGILEN